MYTLKRDYKDLIDEFNNQFEYLIEKIKEIDIDFKFFDKNEIDNYNLCLIKIFNTFIEYNHKQYLTMYHDYNYKFNNWKRDFELKGPKWIQELNSEHMKFEKEIFLLINEHTDLFSISDTSKFAIHFNWTFIMNTYYPMSNEDKLEFIKIIWLIQNGYFSHDTKIIDNYYVSKEQFMQFFSTRIPGRYQRFDKLIWMTYVNIYPQNKFYNSEDLNTIEKIKLKHTIYFIDIGDLKELEYHNYRNFDIYEYENDYLNQVEMKSKYDRIKIPLHFMIRKLVWNLKEIKMRKFLSPS